MKKQYLFIAAFPLLFLFYACPSPFGYPKRNFPLAYFPDSITNMADINSEFDDINMDLPYHGSYQFMVFATNRRSQGEQFDLVSEYVTYLWDQTNGDFSLSPNLREEFQHINYFLSQANTDYDEYGPYCFFYRDDMYLIYSSNKKGTTDVSFVCYQEPHSHRYDSLSPDSFITKSIEIPALSNPEFNEGYVSFYSHVPPYDDLKAFNGEKGIENLIYCSDSLGTWDIYSIPFTKQQLTNEKLSVPTNVKPAYLAALNSEYEDRCPNVCGNFMVFSSDRPGGLGGYDFYYSVFENGSWSEPVNFGEPINSAYDEYRAVAIKAWEYENDLLVFSSNRPGGLGGFDIYFTGIEVMPEIDYEYWNNHY